MYSLIIINGKSMKKCYRRYIKLTIFFLRLYRTWDGYAAIAWEYMITSKLELEYRNGIRPSYYVIMYISRKDEKIYRNMFVIGGDDAIGMPHG